MPFTCNEKKIRKRTDITVDERTSILGAKYQKKKPLSRNNIKLNRER